MAGEMRKLAVQIRRDFFFVAPEDILFVTRKQRKTLIITVQGFTYATADSLEKLEGRLNDERFFRCHKGYLVNAAMVKAFSPWGKKTFLVSFAHTEETALATLDKAKEFREKYGI
ncbi:transcriptional regulatory protein YpdB [Peptococcaceae bacterium CEB3]|nr:transcriptional regulatory protein YpdB [Peptococcaceae bacterium CEB3]